MLSPELYGSLLTAAVLAIVVGILALEKLRLKAKQPSRQATAIYPAEPDVIEADSITKGGSQGI